MSILKKLIRALVIESGENFRVLFSLPILWLLRNRQEASIDDSASVIIFSKDRPLQLEALLDSYECYYENGAKPVIIFNACNEEYQSAYEDLFRRHSSKIQATFDDTKGFKDCLLDALNNLESNRIFFLVDDIIFKKKFDPKPFLKLGKEFIPSLRMGLHLTKCYTQRKSQALPVYNLKDDFVIWNYSNGECDWAYPLSVDGHFFFTEEIRFMTKILNFKAPNSYEAKLQKFRYLYKRLKGVCGQESFIFNIPCNKVQLENENHAGDFHQDDLLKLFKTKKIDFQNFHGLENESCHQEVPLLFKNRN
ncbi:MAG: hypothetical protein ACJAT2_003576 [Bacteriovoracaceae bacterium]|jgi:hypothetical protein